MAISFFKRKKKSEFLKHNKVQLITSGSPFFNLLLELFDHAEDSIHLQTYIFADDQTGKTVADALIRAANRGVAVYLLVDAYGSQAMGNHMTQQLVDAGVQFRKFRPFLRSTKFYLGRRLHHKIIVVDSDKSLVGGLNIADRYNDTPEQDAWLDFALYAEGEVAEELERICFRRMKLRPKQATKNHRRHPEGVCPIRVRQNDWASRQREIYHTYLDLFRNAKSHITIMSAYFLPGRTFRKSIRRATARGVRVRVILTGTADVPLIKYAERYIYRWLFRHKIEVFEYQKNVLHAKIAIADSRLLTVGSFNVNNLSAYGSIECNLDVNDDAFVKNVEADIEAILEKDCLQVTEADMLKKNAFVKLAHKAAYEAYRFLFFVSTKHRE